MWKNFKKSIVFKSVAIFMAILLAIPGHLVFGQTNNSVQNLLSTSANYSYPSLKGLRFNPNNPLKLEFIIDTANQGKVNKDEAAKLIKYFLAGLTLPEDDLWVNLSPYEQDRIVPESLGGTDLGKDMLEQDYILKQLSSSLTYPESPTGRDYWQAIYGTMGKQSNIPVNTFNKVWIMPDQAGIYENGNTAFITESTLKVMMEEDYLAMNNNKSTSAKNNPASLAMKDRILPVITQEVNHGKNFASLRQIYNSLILAVWFKQKFKQSFYKNYIDQRKIKGIDLTDKNIKEKIWQQYVQAFKQGAYDYIKTERVVTKITKRRYFSGGATFKALRAKTQIRSGPSKFFRWALYANLGGLLVATITIGAWAVTKGKPAPVRIATIENEAINNTEFVDKEEASPSHPEVPRFANVQEKFTARGNRLSELNFYKALYKNGLIALDRVPVAMREDFGLVPDDDGYIGVNLYKDHNYSMSLTDDTNKADLADVAGSQNTFADDSDKPLSEAAADDVAEKSTTSEGEPQISDEELLKKTFSSSWKEIPEAQRKDYIAAAKVVQEFQKFSQDLPSVDSSGIRLYGNQVYSPNKLKHLNKFFDLMRAKSGKNDEAIIYALIEDLKTVPGLVREKVDMQDDKINLVAIDNAKLEEIIADKTPVEKDLRRTCRIIRDLVTRDDDRGVKAINIKNPDGSYTVIGLARDLTPEGSTIDHERREIKYLRLGWSEKAAHNQVVKETGEGAYLDETTGTDSVGSGLGLTDKDRNLKIDGSIKLKNIKMRVIKIREEIFAISRKYGGNAHESYDTDSAATPFTPRGMGSFTVEGAFKYALSEGKWKKRGLSFDDKLANAQVMVIGGGNGDEVMAFIRTFPDIAAIHVVDVDSQAFLALEEQLRQFKREGKKVPKIYGYLTTVLELPAELKGKIDVIFVRNVFEEAAFNSRQTAQGGHEMVEALKPGGMIISELNDGHALYPLDGKPMQDVGGGVAGFLDFHIKNPKVKPIDGGTKTIGRQVYTPNKLKHLHKIFDIMRTKTGQSDNEIIRGLLTDLEKEGLITKTEDTLDRGIKINAIDDLRFEAIAADRSPDKKDLRRAIRIIRDLVTNDDPETGKKRGVKALNLKNDDGSYTVIGLSRDLAPEGMTLKHERREIYYLRQGWDEITAHNQAAKETEGTQLDETADADSVGIKRGVADTSITMQPRGVSTLAKKCWDEEIILPGRRVLSLGSGNGDDELFFADHGVQVIASDNDRKNLETLKSRCQGKENISVAQIDITQPLTMIEDSSQDIVYCNLLLHYFPDSVQEKIVQEIQRVLKPGGKLVIRAKSKQDDAFIQGPKKYLGNGMYKLTAHGDWKKYERNFMDTQRVYDLASCAGMEVLFAEDGIREKLFSNDFESTMIVAVVQKLPYETTVVDRVVASHAKEDLESVKAKFVQFQTEVEVAGYFKMVAARQGVPESDFERVYRFTVQAICAGVLLDWKLLGRDDIFLTNNLQGEEYTRRAVEVIRGLSPAGLAQLHIRITQYLAEHSDYDRSGQVQAALQKLMVVDDSVVQLSPEKRSPNKLKVAFVCLANRSRSPVMLLTARELVKRSGLKNIEISSFGIVGNIFVHTNPEIAPAALSYFGISSENARIVPSSPTLDKLVYNDIIIAASQSQKDQIIELARQIGGKDLAVKVAGKTKVFAQLTEEAIVADLNVVGELRSILGDKFDLDAIRRQMPDPGYVGSGIDYIGLFKMVDIVFRRTLLPQFKEYEAQKIAQTVYSADGQKARLDSNIGLARKMLPRESRDLSRRIQEELAAMGSGTGEHIDYYLQKLGDVGADGQVSFGDRRYDAEILECSDGAVYMRVDDLFIIYRHLYARLSPGLKRGLGTNVILLDKSKRNIMMTTAVKYYTVAAIIAMKQGHWQGKRVVDVGCGNGILAIVAAKLGADQFVFIDNDPTAMVYQAPVNFDLNVDTKHLREGRDFVFIMEDIKEIERVLSQIPESNRDTAFLINIGKWLGESGYTVNNSDGIRIALALEKYGARISDFILAGYALRVYFDATSPGTTWFHYDAPQEDFHSLAQFESVPFYVEKDWAHAQRAAAFYTHRDLPRTVQAAEQTTSSANLTGNSAETVLGQEAKVDANTEHVSGNSMLLFPANQQEKEKLDSLREGLNREFGVWYPEAAMQKNTHAFVEMEIFLAQYADGQRYHNKEDYAFLHEICHMGEEYERFILAIEQLAEGSAPDGKIIEKLGQFLIDDGSDQDFVEYAQKVLTGLARVDRSQCREAIKRFDDLMQTRARLSQWDFLNRFPGANGMRLFRGEAVGGKFLAGVKNTLKEKLFFTPNPDYALSFFVHPDDSVIVADVGVEAIAHTGWVTRQDNMYEPEVVVSGDIFMHAVYSWGTSSADDLLKLLRLRRKQFLSLQKLDQRLRKEDFRQDEDTWHKRIADIGEYLFTAAQAREKQQWQREVDVELSLTPRSGDSDFGRAQLDETTGADSVDGGVNLTAKSFKINTTGNKFGVGAQRAVPTIQSVARYVPTASDNYDYLTFDVTDLKNITEAQAQEFVGRR